MEQSMWNKPMNELTPKESVVIQMEIIAGMVAVLAAGWGALAVVEKVRQKRIDKANAKFQAELDKEGISLN